MVDRLVEALHSEARLREVARNGHDPPLGSTEPLGEGVELPARALAYQRMNRAVALQQLGHEVPADEAGRAGDEVVQESSLGVCAAV